MKPPKLRPAAELRDERARRRTRVTTDTHERALSQVIELIDKAHSKNETSVTYLTFPESVVDALRNAGYRVRFYRASNFGDVDTHEISWD